MTFYLLHRQDGIPFKPDETLIVAQCDTVAELQPLIVTWTERVGTIEIVETLFHMGTKAPVTKAVPCELTRAIEAWNRIADRTTPKLAKIRKPENFISAYRRWLKRNTGRTYLLEQIVPLVERVRDWHEWIHFGWLLGQKDGAENVEKLMQRAKVKASGGAEKAKGFVGYGAK